jgi:hypothetical protein
MMVNLWIGRQASGRVQTTTDQRLHVIAEIVAWPPGDERAGAHGIDKIGNAQGALSHSK